MLDDFLDFPLKFLVVGLDILQSNFFVGLEFLVQVDQSLDFGLLGLDDFFQTVDVGVVELNETCFLVGRVLPQFLNLPLVESCQLCDSDSVSVVVLLQL